MKKSRMYRVSQNKNIKLILFHQIIQSELKIMGLKRFLNHHSKIFLSLIRNNPLLKFIKLA